MKRLTELHIEVDAINKIINNQKSDLEIIAFIKDIVCEGERITKYALLSKSHKRELVTARFMCCQLIRDYTGASLNKIAVHMNKAHHTTILHAFNTFKSLVETNSPEIKNYKDYERKVRAYVSDRRSEEMSGVATGPSNTN